MELSNEERLEVQAAIDLLRLEARQGVAERAELDEEASDPERGISVYRVPAAQDRGEAILNRFGQRLREAVGDDRGSLLLKGFDTKGRFGGFGRYDVRIEFYDIQPDDLPPQVIWNYRDAETGDLRSSGEMNIESFKTYFGESFRRVESGAPDQ